MDIYTPKKIDIAQATIILFVGLRIIFLNMRCGKFPHDRDTSVDRNSGNRLYVKQCSYGCTVIDKQKSKMK
jgi:hypothetical protein